MGLRTLLSAKEGLALDGFPQKIVPAHGRAGKAQVRHNRPVTLVTGLISDKS